MKLNAVDGGNRHHILVQSAICRIHEHKIPEPLEPENKDQKAAIDFCNKRGRSRNIAELTKERLRRAANFEARGLLLDTPVRFAAAALIP